MEVLQIVNVDGVLSLSVPVPCDGEDQPLVVVGHDGRVSNCYSALYSPTASDSTKKNNDNSKREERETRQEENETRTGASRGRN